MFLNIQFFTFVNSITYYCNSLDAVRSLLVSDVHRIETWFTFIFICTFCTLLWWFCKRCCKSDIWHKSEKTNDTKWTLKLLDGCRGKSCNIYFLLVVRWTANLKPSCSSQRTLPLLLKVCISPDLPFKEKLRHSMPAEGWG